MIFDKSPKTRIILCAVSMVLGAACLGALAPVISNQGFIRAMATAYIAGGGQTYGAATSALLATIVGGALSIAAGIVGLIATALKNTPIYIFFLVLSTIGALICIIGGGYYQVVFPIIGINNYLPPTNDIKPPLSGANAQYLDFTQAIFSTCCVKQGWAAQNETVACTGVDATDCLAISLPAVIIKVITTATTLLCECVTSIASLDSFEAGVAGTDLCTQAENTLVNAASLSLPVPGLSSFTLTELTNEQTPYQYTYIPIVGYNVVPGMAGAPANTVYPFGCGLGFVKGLSWMLDTWHQQNTQISSTAVLALGCVQWAFLILGGIIGYMQHKEEAMERNGQLGVYDQNLDKPASFYVPAGRAAPQQPAAYLQNEPGVVHVSGPKPVDSVEKERIASKLRAFYAKYDPGKDLADVDDVSAWAVLNGIGALNKKLSSKYGADLESVGADKPKVPDFNKLDI